MANIKNGITRADAIAYAMERCTDNPDVIEVLNRLHTQFTKKSPKANTKSAARITNEGYATRLHKFVIDNNITDAIDTRWVVDNFEDIATPQKAVAIFNVAVEMGLFHKNVVQHGKRTTFTFTIC